MKHSFSVFILLFSTKILYAQNYVDILKINGNLTSLNNFDSSTASTNIKELGADLTYPIKINDSNTVLTGLIYEQIQTKLFENQNEKIFSSICLKAGLNKKFSEAWSGTFVLLPKIASDFGSLGAKDFQLGAIALMKYRKSDNLNYKFGLYYNSELFGPFFVPMFGLYYLSPDKKLETNLMLPLQADVNYKLISLINIGFNFNGQIRSYHLSNITPVYNSSYVSKSTNEFYTYLKFNFGKSLSLHTKAGHSLARRYRVYDENDKITFGLPATFIGGHRKQLNTDFSDGLLFQFILLYRFNL